MSLMGIDVGTTTCKVAIFRDSGSCIASSSAEYDVLRPSPGRAELDARGIWELVKKLIKQTASAARRSAGDDPVCSVAVSSLGEATVPVSRDREILGTSILYSDTRGQEYLGRLARILEPERLYEVNGNVPGNHYSLTKLLWIQEYCPDMYRRAFKFLHWGPFISFMLGAEPAVDHSLANRTLLFDLEAETWSGELLGLTGLDREKLPDTVPSGTPVGKVAAHLAEELGLPGDVSISAGAHDQCANAVGCGVIDEGSAMFGLGTVLCAVPVFTGRKEASLMIPRGLNTEHHAAAGRFVSFIYNQGGSLVKWYRDTFAPLEHARAEEKGKDVYVQLFNELPGVPGDVLVLPHFDPTGPPRFIDDSSEVIAGLRLDTSRADILQGILEGCAYYIKECVDDLPAAGIEIDHFRAVGGGSKSLKWLQLCADIFARPFIRLSVREAGVLGAAILGAVGDNRFGSVEESVKVMVRDERVIEPDMQRNQRYNDNYERYKKLWPAWKAV